MINKKIFHLLALLMITLVLALSPAYSGDPARIGTAAGEQLMVPRSARDLAMGGANIALTSGLNAIYWNPAGLPRLETTAAAQFSTITIFNDITSSYLAVAYKTEDLGTFGFSINSIDVGDIPETTREDMDGESGRTFSPTFITVGLTYSKLLTDAISVGFTTKLIHEAITAVSASTVAFDIGLQYQGLGGIEGVCFGLAIKNIGGSLDYQGSGLGVETQNETTGRRDFLRMDALASDLPATIEIGVAYEKAVMENGNVIVSSVFANNNFDNDAIKFGVEYGYDDFLFVRGGYNYVQDIETEDQLYDLTLGAGVKYDLGDAVLILDYAFRNDQYFDANNMISFTVGF